MNVRVEVLDASRPAARARVADYVEMTKPRITGLVMMTTWVGFFVANPVAVDIVLLIHTLIGTALVCAGSGTLNQVWERAHDARMQRTRQRPVPSGRVRPLHALAFGVALSVVGLLQLAVFVNGIAALLTGLTLAVYVFVYTPLKRVSWISTTIGAVPGALPPVIGWAAAAGRLDAGAWTLFAVQFVWQLPHFYSLAWMYRDDYARGGFKMLTVLDKSGSLTTTQIVSWAAVLLPASLLPTMYGIAGAWYAVPAVLLGAWFLWLSFALLRERSVARAKRVFLVSVLYLPAVLGFLVLDNWIRI